MSSFLSETSGHSNFHVWLFPLSLIIFEIESCSVSPTLCHPMDYTVHGLLQARILEWVAVTLSRGSFQPRDRIHVLTLQAGSLPAEPPGKSKNIREGSLSLLQWIFPTRNQTRVSYIAGGFFTS